MKLSQLKRLILETLEEEVEPQYEVYDDLGKFYQVKRPAVGMTKEDMVCEVTAFDEINKDETHGIYKNRSEANRNATELLKNYELLQAQTLVEELAFKQTSKQRHPLAFMR